MQASAIAPDAELVAHAQQLQAGLERRSGEIDQLRQLPQDLAEKLAALGFYRLVVPESLGGLGISPETFCRICETLAMANGSAAWCVFIGATSQYLFGAVPSEYYSEQKRAGYKDYQQRTNRFFPGRPRRSS